MDRQKLTYLTIFSLLFKLIQVNLLRQFLGYTMRIGDTEEMPGDLADVECGGYTRRTVDPGRWRRRSSSFLHGIDARGCG